jgi:hypothetical protein
MHGFDLAGCGFCCVGLGVARAALDAFAELAQTKAPRGAYDLLRPGDGAGHRGQGRNAAMLGHALLLQVVEEMWETALVAQPITERQRAALRLAMTHAAQSAAEAPPNSPLF